MLEPITTLDDMPMFKITQDMEQDLDTAINEIFDSGHHVFYLLGSKKISQTFTVAKTKKQHVQIDYKPAIYRVVKNFIGYGMALYEENIDELDVLGNKATIVLPPIPAAVISKIDQFFRYVYRQEHTESVILFTFDPDYLETDNPQDGWGFLVPEQSNSSVSCDYDPSSVMEEKPFNVRIVGTAHSHPNMSAFCSGTDKSDQMGFDGVHITYGWRGDGPTDFHCEVQMADYGFGSFKDEDIFENPKGPEVDPEIVELAKKVTKLQHRGSQPVPSIKAKSDDNPAVKKGLPYKNPGVFPNLPAGCPSPRAVNLLWFHDEPHDKLENCPVCDSKFTDWAKKSQRCVFCSLYIVGADQNFDEYKKARADHNVVNKELEEETANNPIWMFDKILGPVEIFPGNNPENEVILAEGDSQELADDEWACPTCHLPNNVQDELCWMCSSSKQDDGGLAS